MASLINSEGRSIDSFFNNIIVPLSFYGLGSVDSLLALKRYEIEELRYCLRDEDTRKLHHFLHNIPVK